MLFCVTVFALVGLDTERINPKGMVDSVAANLLRHDGLQGDKLKINLLHPTEDIYKQLFDEFEHKRFSCAWSTM